MRAFRHLAFAVLSAAAAVLVTMGLMLVVEAFRGDSAPEEVGPGVYLGVGALCIATALLLGWAAWAIRRRRSGDA